MSFQCPICLSSEYQKELECTDYTTSKEKFDIVSCKRCGLWQTYPHPNEQNIDKYYQSPQYISHSDKKNSFLDKIYHLVRKYTVLQKVNLVKKYVPRGTILDYGCGTGYFLKTCLHHKMHAYGVEPNETARNLAIQKNIPVEPNILPYLKSQKNFDLITLWHVLEHLHQPIEFIKIAYQLLSNKSYLILALPNRNSYDAKFYQSKWAGYDVPRHLFHYTEKDIIHLSKNYFTLIDIHPMFFDSFYVSILSEKYKQSSIPFLKGMYRGLISNIKASQNHQYSSLIYVLQKN